VESLIVSPTFWPDGWFTFQVRVVELTLLASVSIVVEESTEFQRVKKYGGVPPCQLMRLGSHSVKLDGVLT